MHNGRRWYLLAFDRGRGDWRTLRVDRLHPHTPTGPRFTPRDMPDDEAARRVTHGIAAAFGTCRTRALVHAPAQTVRQQLPPMAVVEALDATSCRLHIGAETPMVLAVYLLALDADFHVDHPPELLNALAAAANRCNRAADAQ